MKPTVDQTILLGVPVDNLKMSTAVERIMKMTEHYKQDGKQRLVATANVDFIVNANSKADEQGPDSLKKILRNADLVTADGMPLVWLSQLIGTPLDERVTGADLVPALAEKASQNGKSLYLLGGKDGSAKATAKILQSRFPGLKIAGYSAPMINLDDEMENTIEIARINITQPDILLIALGNPKQEFWFERYKKSLKVPVSIGVGGTFEFIAGMTSRAPAWMQEKGIEWLYRMTQDPKRLVKRYANGLLSFNIMALPLVLANVMFKLISKARNLYRSGKAEHAGLNRSSVSASDFQVQQTKTGDQTVLEIDLSDRIVISPVEVLQLLKVINHAQEQSQVYRVSGISWITRQILRFYRVLDLFTHAGPISHNPLPGKEQYSLAS